MVVVTVCVFLFLDLSHVHVRDCMLKKNKKKEKKACTLSEDAVSHKVFLFFCFFFRKKHMLLHAATVFTHKKTDSDNCDLTLRKHNKIVAI